MTNILRRVLGVGRVVALATGVALMVGLVRGLASVALAGTGVGGVFNLGQVNSVNNAITQLTGSVNHAMLLVQNTNTGSAATALDLRVASGKPPMRVSSTTKVANLNSDLLDGLDSSAFVQASTPTYSEEVVATGTEGEAEEATVSCDQGDKRLSGGFTAIDPGKGIITGSEPFGIDERTWKVTFDNPADPDSGTAEDVVRAFVLCADFPPLRA